MEDAPSTVPDAHDLLEEYASHAARVGVPELRRSTSTRVRQIGAPESGCYTVAPLFGDQGTVGMIVLDDAHDESTTYTLVRLMGVDCGEIARVIRVPQDGGPAELVS